MVILPPRAYVFIGLNAVRVLSIVALLLVFASNIVTLVNDVEAVNRFMDAGSNNSTTGTAGNSTLDAMRDYDYIPDSTVPNQPAGAAWAVLNRLFIIFQAVVLIMAEIGWPSQFFLTYFPILGREFGLGALGLIQMLIGAAILSHRVDTFTLVAAFFLFAIGCLNTLLGLVFRAGAKTKRSVTSWREHAKSALPTHVGPVNIVPVRDAALDAGQRFMHEKLGKKSPFGTPDPSAPPSFLTAVHTGSTARSAASTEKTSGLGFGPAAEKQAGYRGFLLSKPLEALPPRYAQRPFPGGRF